MPKQRGTIRNYPARGGLINTGGQSTIDELGLWELENFTTDFDGRLRKRSGVRQWGQALKQPKNNTMGFTELFNDLTHFNLDDASAGGNVDVNNTAGVLTMATTAATGGTENSELRRLSQASDGVRDVAESTQFSIRFLFRSQSGLPAQDSTDDRGFSISLRTPDSAFTRQFLFLDDGIYVLNGATAFEQVAGTDVDDGAWHVIEIQVQSAACNIIIDDGTPIATPTLGATPYIAGLPQTGVTMKARTNSNGTYKVDLDFLQAQSSVTNPFVGSGVDVVQDWSSVVPRQQHLLAIAGNTIYKDDGHQGIWRALDSTSAGDLTVLAPYQTELIIMHPNLGMRRWGGKLAPEAIPGAPKGRIGTEHLGRLWITTQDMPLRVYFSGAGNLQDWTTEEGGSFTTSGFININDPRGRRITAMMGDYYGQLIVCTESSTWRITGTSLEDFRVENISLTVGCVGPRAITRVQNDVVYLSNHGLHSLQTVQEFGDIEEKFLSMALRNRFQPNTFFDLKRIRPDYRSTVTHVPHSNRTYLGVPIEGDTRVEHIFELNHGTNQWTGPWDVDGQAAAFVLLGYPGQPLLFMGDSQGRVGFVNDDRRLDWGTDAYTAKLRSARLDGRSLSPAATRRTVKWIELRLYVLSRADGNITVSWNADGHRRGDSDTFALNVYDDNIIGDATDTTFVLDSSSETIDAERTGVISVPMDMRGKWMEFEITQSGADQDFMLAGYEIDSLPQQDDKENA